MLRRTVEALEVSPTPSVARPVVEGRLEVLSKEAQPLVAKKGPLPMADA